MTVEQETQYGFGEPDEWAFAQGYELVAGVDEVGRGAMAGPLVAAAVIISPDTVPTMAADSKTLSVEQRNEACEEIRQSSIAWAIGVVEPDMIDRLNVWGATCLAMRRALEGLRVRPDFTLIDGLEPRGIQVPYRCFIGGDACSPRIGAASILAKVMRDRMMERLALIYRGYGLECNRGYMTLEHRKAVRRLGPSPIHRRRFRLVAEMRGNHLPFDPKEMAGLTESGAGQ